MVTDRPWRVQHWIDRLNWLAGLSQDERDSLRQLCTMNGRHFKSGERFLTYNPIHVCYVCGDEFQE